LYWNELLTFDDINELFKLSFTSSMNYSGLLVEKVRPSPKRR
jgi:hypothetical protein